MSNVKNALTGALKMGILLTGGFVAHKAITKLVSDWIIPKLMVAVAPAAVITPATATTPATVTPQAGILDSLYPYREVVAALLAAVGGVVLVQKFVKNDDTKRLLAGGMATSVLHTVLVAGLRQLGASDKVTGYLGASDSAAARLSAMYGMGASIMPRYAAAAGYGEYFAQNGLGEFFESGVEGLGNYSRNPDLMQAAAGYGDVPEIVGQHISPGSDLDQELTIAEAAAGVGEMYQAAAGMGAMYEAAAGLGDFYGPGGTIGTAQTWIPGQSAPSVTAGVRAITAGQAANAETTAGILQTGGGGGVFG